MLKLIVIAFGALIGAYSIAGFIRPSWLMSIVTRFADARWSVTVAVGVRVALGVVLILVAPQSRFPTTMFVLGVVALVAALGLLIMGRQRIRGLVRTIATWSTGSMRLWLVAGFGFGGFLIYAVS